MLDYLEQWNRLERYYKKVLDLELNEQNLSSDECLEEMYLFFENCFKLRDWVRNSEYVGKKAKTEITELFENDKNLSVCAGLANRRKHLRIDSRKRYGDSSVVSHSVTVMVPVLRIGSSRPQTSSITKAKYNWGLKSGGEKFELIRLAKLCMEEIKTFMSDHNLLSQATK
ncbi:MAG: hypothetical protein AAB786_01600 [Patescibacteria group bacterium]